MAPGSSYRHYFHRTVTRNYNSLGDATAVFNRKLRALRQEEAIPSSTGPLIPTRMTNRRPLTTSALRLIHRMSQQARTIPPRSSTTTTIPTRLILGTP